MKTGRPRRNAVVSVATNVRMTPEERARYTALANARHMTLSQWIRLACEKQEREHAPIPG